MSEYTNYYAFSGMTYKALKNKLQLENILAVIDDNPDRTDLKWVAVEIANDYDKRLEEKEKLSHQFTKVVEIWIDEDYQSWEIICFLLGKKKTFDCTNNPSKVTDEDKKYLSELFETPFEDFELYLKKGEVQKFCDIVKMPCNIMSNQTIMPRGFLEEQGGVVLASEITG